MHKAWSQLGTLIDPESKPGSCESTFRNFPASVQPLCAFFEIGDDVMSKFHDAAAFRYYHAGLTFSDGFSDQLPGTMQ